MLVELISVGTEILMGNIVNTNAQYLAEKLTAQGCIIHYHVSVGDNRERLKESFLLALQRSDLVILSGGLGPTEDDLTREVCAEALGMPLREDEALKAHIHDYLTRSVYKCPASNNYKQAMVPEGATVLRNDNGTAPGLILEKDGKAAILLPGPPCELYPMFEKQVLPYLQARQESRLYSVMVKVCGIGEAQIEDKLLDLIEGQHNPTLATYAKTGETHIRVTAQAESAEAGQKLLKPIIKEIKKRLGNAVYTLDEAESLPAAVVRLLKKYDLTVTTAESCTGGLVAAALTGVPGSSSVFKQGFVTYSNKAKRKLLSIKKEQLKRYGAISEDCARDMALGALVSTEADLSVAITGNAGPTASEDKPVGLVYISCCFRGKLTVEGFQFNGDRSGVRKQAVIKALDLLRRTILEHGKEA